MMKKIVYLLLLLSTLFHFSCGDDEITNDVQNHIYDESTSSDSEGADSYGGGDDYLTVSGKEGNYSYVDLGLSVRWATFNVGAANSTEYGDLFSWGEITPKQSSGWESYKWGSRERVSINCYIYNLVKYNVDADCGSIDGKTQLESDDDAATANWGALWRMPSKEEIEEMAKECYWHWTDNMNDSGVSGQVGVSKRNGNVIFFPVQEQGIRESRYWSNTLSYDDWSVFACDLSFGDGAYATASSRNCPNFVRAVCPSKK